MNDFSNSNLMPFTTSVYNQQPITYKHLYILFVPHLLYNIQV